MNNVEALTVDYSKEINPKIYNKLEKFSVKLI
jgi:hypothetical protein